MKVDGINKNILYDNHVYNNDYNTKLLYMEGCFYRSI